MQTSIESQNQESPLSPRRRSRVIFSNEPISVRAMKNLGFTKEDLEYPSEARINEFTRNPAFKSFVREELTKDVDERLKLFNEEKQRIKEEDEQRKQENLENTESEDQSEFDFESIELKMQRTIERHKKQIELKIFQALAEKYRKENEIKRAELEQLRLEEFRQSIIQKHMIEEENNARRQEFFNQKETERMERIELYMKAEAERQQKYLQRKEEEKIKREQEKMEFEQMLQEKLLIHNEIERQKDETRREQLKSKLLILEERERRVQQSRQEAMIRFKTKNDQKQEIHNQLKSEIDSIRQKKINSLRKKAAERDAQLQEKLRKLDEEKKQILLEKRSKTEIVVQRAQMVREEKQKEKEKVNEIYIQRQKRAEEKLKQMEEERYLDYIQSLEIEKSIKERLRLLKEEQENEIRRKHDEVYEKDRIRTKQIEEKRQEEAFEREFEALKEKIAVSRKQFNLLVKERQQSLLNQEKQTEMVQKMKELAEKENRRKQKLILYLQQKQIAESKIRYFEQKISEELSMAKTEGQLRQIAENYDIDFESIDAKARNPKGNRQTINDFITQMGGNTSTLKDNE
ncbi:hypothetical protein TRFO_37533 [Tritrichomonas foetus]|uniref:Uncharacterized protein n=1 Tax=Tritrichomonas foetus TaxID=1144522 RepID=A0A1J4JF66_9EUKA|nr:hypothetical protein TRFO_37533 [Tritrichomonas foetus]|eukprot:OHS96291.1 hypothetical protein TRFO_37533 [Tritrichomonas foetus]